jgi:hypothetical protein
LRSDSAFLFPDRIKATVEFNYAIFMGTAIVKGVVIIARKKGIWDDIFSI